MALSESSRRFSSHGGAIEDRIRRRITSYSFRCGWNGDTSGNAFNIDITAFHVDIYRPLIVVLVKLRPFVCGSSIVR
jgi:hypothetical protein